MIDKKNITEIVNNKLAETENLFLVEIKVSKTNIISIYIDSDNQVELNDCVSLSKFIESKFDRNIEDYELNVSSAGLSSPLLMLRQYKKHIGKKIEILKAGSKKIIGTLISANETGFKIKEEIVNKGKKHEKAIELEQEQFFSYSDVNIVKLHLEFK